MDPALLALIPPLLSILAVTRFWETFKALARG